MTDIATVDLHFIDMPADHAAADTTPLVVIHGLLGSADNWRSHLKVWQRSRRVIALDLRNHGRSPHAEGMQYATMAADVLALLDKLAIQRAHVLGHSMGGKVAISVARLAPERVASLIIADIAPVAYEHSHDDVFAALASVREGQPKNRREADDLIAQHVDSRPTRLFLATNLVRNDDNVIIGVPDGKQPYEGPSLVLRGSESHYVADDMLPALREVMPRARVVTLKNAGHWLHADQPEAFQQAVDVFVSAQ